MISSTLRMLRFFRGITLDELSRKADVDPATLSRLERGLLKDTLGSRRIKEKVAKAVGVSSESLFGKSEDQL